MDWKEFLKPDLRKILLFIMLFGILFIIPVEYEKMSDIVCACENCACSQPQKMLVKTSIGVEYINSFFAYNTYSTYTIVDGMKRALIGFVSIFGFYVLSCAIVSGYDKLKFKK